MFERITFESNIMGGRACIRGTRIPVSVIVGQIAHGASFEEILDGYPDLEREDIEQAKDIIAGQLRMCRVEQFFPKFEDYLEDIAFLVVNTQQKHGTHFADDCLVQRLRIDGPL